MYMSHRGLKPLWKLQSELKEYGWELVGEYKGSHKPATFKCLKCGKNTTVTRAKSIRTAICKNCNTHICLNCGKEFEIKNGKGIKTSRRFCYECLPESTVKMSSRNEYHNLWYKYVVSKIIERYGDSCKICGYNKCFDALDFHHLDKNSKEHSPAIMIHSSYDLNEIFKELDKCILVCSNCHREIHSNDKEENNES